MDAPRNQVLFPTNFTDLFSLWSRYPDAIPFAGGTALVRAGSEALNNVKLAEMPALPKNILSLEHIEELHRVTRTERYLEIGAMVRLNGIIALGKSVPPALRLTLEGIAGPQVRNLATIGGNICSIGKPGGGVDAAAPMTALDARYELRTAGQSRWISAMRFSSFDSGSALGERELLTRVRIPLENWNYCVYRKFHSRDLGNERGGVFIFTARNEKDILTELRVVFAGAMLLRDKNSESFLEGKRLPLERRETGHFAELWKGYLEGMAEPGPLLKAKIANSIEDALTGLAG
jgi:CO/xanthine dehydrogenase FAD-binding subunit